SRRRSMAKCAATASAAVTKRKRRAVVIPTAGSCPCWAAGRGVPIGQRLALQTLALQSDSQFTCGTTRAFSSRVANLSQRVKGERTVTHVVCEPCRDCKYTDCVVVCPVDCFYQDERMLYIDPLDCIDCGACIPECPV